MIKEGEKWVKKSVEIPDEIWDVFIKSEKCSNCDLRAKKKCIDFSKIADGECDDWRFFIYDEYNSYKKGVVSETVGKFLLWIFDLRPEWAHPRKRNRVPAA